MSKRRAAGCRGFGSVHDAEDLVQETYLRGWRGYPAFEERAALRTWLYRIATTACLRALQHRGRRVLPAGLGDSSVDPKASLDDNGGTHQWLEPIPDSLLAALPAPTPEDTVAVRHSVRLAVMTALQELPARRDVVMLPTAVKIQPAVAEYRRTADDIRQAHSIHVLDANSAGIAAITVFLDRALFSAFGLPPSR
ncbi:sigma factor [Mycobacterium shigaense]|uniref:sigma factor n=1 Tax=Mycobacterium shigaense TaxID=722731 RepID=UPI00280B11DA|nr:sigma factor [Mycobacterium shigaense]MEA1121284.1 sigma factor [Mycobacterium shigaense]